MSKYETIVGIDGKKHRILKDGGVLRTRMVAMDSVDASPARFFDSQTNISRETADSAQYGIGYHRVVASDGLGGHHLSRPGPRYPVLTEEVQGNRDSMRTVYDAYDFAVSSAWQNNPPTGQGSRGFTNAVAGALCTCRGPDDEGYEGDPGHLVERGGKLICRSDRYRDDEGDEGDDAEANTGDSVSLSQRVTDHAQKMDALYKERDAELSEAWRRK